MEQNDFIKKAAEIGMDGLILPDVPFEEKEEFDTRVQKIRTGSDLPDRADFP